MRIPDLRDGRVANALRSPPRGRVADALVALVCLLLSALSVLILRHGDEDVTVTVADDGDTAAASAVPAGDGSGIRGMRDRAEALGGTLEAGPGPDGGFTVRARIPL